ncbi:galactitol-1-phosphate 5-dehydrogenase [Clostridium sediminicola]|uniref:zinc-dependent alcohol dehydrogenase n=1 Tax=Clostridium sediminicola TaxID=3114879 RepID=UPI0031F22868
MKRRVAVLTAPMKFEIVEEEIPKIAPHEVLIKVVSIGLCHSDMPTYYGQSAMGYDKYGHFTMVKDLQYPLALGHEPVGIIEEVGSGVTHLKVGDYVGGPIAPAFASHIVAIGAMCVPVPKTVKDLKYCLPEPLTCVSNIVQVANPKLGDTVAVVGCGMMGLLTIAGLKHSGASDIIAIDVLDNKLELAKEFGATVTLNPKNVDMDAEINAITNNAGVDVVVEITGSLRGLKTATSIIRHADMYGYAGRGKILIPSVYGREEKWDPQIGYDLMFRSPILHSTHPWYCEDYLKTAKAGINAYISGILPLQKLISHEFSLEDIGKGFELMASGDPSYIKGIILP